MIKLIISRDNESNTGYIYREIGNRLRQGKSSYLFVPEQYTLLSDINLMDALSVDCIMDIKVKSFSGLSREVLSKVGGIKKGVIGESGRAMLIRKILQENSRELSLYRSGTNSPGFIEEILKTITELKNADVGTEKLRACLNKPGITELLSKKLAEITLIYEKYNEKLSGHYLDSADRLDLLWEKLDGADYLKDINMYFNFFHDMNRKEISIIEKLHTMGIEVVVCVTLDPRLLLSDGLDTIGDGELFNTTYAFVKKLRAITDDIQILKKDVPPQNILTTLASNLFSYKPEICFDETEDISFYQAANSDGEVRYVVESILKLIRDEGYQFRDIGIITTDPVEYDKQLFRALKKEDIPAFLDRRKSFTENRLAKILMTIINLKARRLLDEDVMYFLKFGFIDASDEDVFVFENYIRSRRIRGNMYFDDKYFSLDKDYFSRQSAKKKEEMIREYTSVNRVRQELLELIEGYITAHENKATIDRHLRVLFEMLMFPKVRETLNEYILVNSEYEELKSENSQVWEMFMTLLDELAELTEDDEYLLSSSEFASIILDGFEQLSIGIIPPSQDQIVIGSISRTRANKVKALFMMGMTDLYLPKKLNTPSILTDLEKDEIAESDIELPRSEGVAQEEMMSVYSLILKAEKKLYMTTSLRNSKNENMNPSRYFHQAKTILPGVVFRTEDPNNTLFRYSKAELFSKMTREIRYAVNNRQSDISPEVKESIKLYKYFKDTKVYCSEIEAVEAAIANKTGKRQLDPVLTDRLYAGLNKVSASRLENYARCPYRHFVLYGLKPNSPDEYELQYNEVGSIIHGVLSRMIAEYKRDPKTFEDYEDMDFEKLVDSYCETESIGFADKNRIEAPKNLAILNFAKKTASLGAKHIARQLSQGDFVPIAEELGFGPGRELQGISVRLGDETIEIEGFIDRVDSVIIDGSRYLSVIDYKTGKRVFDLRKAIAGIEIQLVLYLMAALGIQGDNDAKPAGFFYAPIRDELMNLETDVREEVEKLIKNSLLMDGIVISNAEVLKAIDRDYESGSSVIRFRGTKRTIKDKDNVLSEQKLDELIVTVYEGIKNSLNSIKEGDISAYPYAIDRKESACMVCEFNNMCRFSDLRDKRFRHLEKVDLKSYKEGLDE